MDEIHARNKKKGLRFRIWSTVTDSYLTEDLTEDELRRYTLESAVCNAIEVYLREIEERIRRAKTYGSSSRMTSKDVCDTPWLRKRG